MSKFIVTLLVSLILVVHLSGVRAWELGTTSTVANQASLSTGLTAASAPVIYYYGTNTSPKDNLPPGYASTYTGTIAINFTIPWGNGVWTFSPNVTSIASTFYSSCGLVNQSQVYCWGHSQYLGFGANSTGDNSLMTAQLAYQTPYPITITSISATQDSTFAVLSNGSIVSWSYGSSSSGQTTPSQTPALIPYAATPYNGLICSAATCLANTSTATSSSTASDYYMWGSEYWATSPSTIANPANLSFSGVGNPSNTFTLLGLSETFGFGILTNGQAICWGDNSYLQCGSSGLLVSSYPTPTTISPPATFDHLSVGYAHALALSNGVLYGWGAHGNNQLDNNLLLCSSLLGGLINGCSFHTLSTFSGVALIDIAAAQYTSFALDSSHLVYWWGQSMTAASSSSLSPTAFSIPSGYTVHSLSHCYSRGNFINFIAVPQQWIQTNPPPLAVPVPNAPVSAPITSPTTLTPVTVNGPQTYISPVAIAGLPPFVPLNQPVSSPIVNSPPISDCIWNDGGVICNGNTGFDNGLTIGGPSLIVGSLSIGGDFNILPNTSLFNDILLNVTGCIQTNGSTYVNLNPQNLGNGQHTVDIWESDCQTSQLPKVLVANTNTCQIVTVHVDQTQASTGRYLLTAMLEITTNKSCQKSDLWWIILASVIGGIALIIFTLLVVIFTVKDVGQKIVPIYWAPNPGGANRPVLHEESPASTDEISSPLTTPKPSPRKHIFNEP